MRSAGISLCADKCRSVSQTSSGTANTCWAMQEIDGVWQESTVSLRCPCGFAWRYSYSYSRTRPCHVAREWFLAERSCGERDVSIRCDAVPQFVEDEEPETRGRAAQRACSTVGQAACGSGRTGSSAKVASGTASVSIFHVGVMRGEQLCNERMVRIAPARDPFIHETINPLCFAPGNMLASHVEAPVTKACAAFRHPPPRPSASPCRSYPSRDGHQPARGPDGCARVRAAPAAPT